MTADQVAVYIEFRIRFGDLPNVRIRTEADPMHDALLIHLEEEIVSVVDWVEIPNMFGSRVMLVPHYGPPDTWTVSTRIDGIVIVHDGARRAGAYTARHVRKAVDARRPEMLA